MRRLVYLLIVIVLLLAACQSAADEAVGSAADTEAADVTEDGDTSNGKLVIYSGRSESLVQPIIDEFAAATGIEVEVRYGKTAEMAGVLLEEGENSPADLFYAQDPGGLGAVQAAGLLRPLESDILDQVPARFTAEDGSWVGISGRARTVVYNNNLFDDPANQLPQDLMGFTALEWNGRIGWAPSNGSFQAMVTALRATWGEEQTRAWLEGIQVNNPVVYPKNTPIVEGVANGEVDVGFVNHYYLYRFLSEHGESFSARNYFLPSGGPGSLIMVSGAGILNGADNVENAQKFIDYLLSPSGQAYFSSQTYEYPVIEGIKSQVTPTLAELDEMAMDISLADLADLAGTQDMLIDLGILE
ncbi:MAG: iron ABC transporter substrate-binding protein [Chloroflexi bacterium]|nr:iron ABC transporter substrate-binding protein [Chloroflexota bacterium]